MQSRLLSAIFTILFAAAIPCGAQVYNSNSGGWNTGYGTVYGSFGLAMATQNLYNTTQMNMQRLMARQAMINKWGLAAVEKAERDAAAGKKSSSGTGTQQSAPEVSAPPVVRNYGKFKPDATVNTAKQIADAVGETPEEKALLIKIVEGTRQAFEAEALSKGWKNDIAGAMTFFIVSNATVYSQNGEPSDANVEALYFAIRQSIDEIPEFGAMKNRDKHGLYNTLIGFAGIPLMTYIEGVNSQDAATVEVAKQLAGKMIEMVMKTSPDKIRIENGSISFVQ